MRGELHDTAINHDKLKETTEPMDSRLSTTIANNQYIIYSCTTRLAKEALRNSLKITGVTESLVTKDQESTKSIPEDTKKGNLRYPFQKRCDIRQKRH